MAAYKANTFVLSLFMLLLLQQHFDHISASRAALPLRASPITTRAYLGKPTSTSLHFTINRYKMTETEAFRPTTPGHSPGIGHDNPPSGH
uniref:Uncharacterized protein n=1 Tax=Gossypium raimondii TaxID=29730 RepID=A0A0D2R6L2_GOSRA|nr:hypothetical protein B456_004G176800 [Gossypium raimondii]